MILKKLILSILSVCFLQSFLIADCENICETSCSISKNTWLPRVFSSYSMHDLTQQAYEDQYDVHGVKVSFFTEYMQNFGSKCGHVCKNLGSMPFWSGTNTMTVGNNDGKADLDAWQFGLGNVVADADGIAGVIQLNPKIQHVGTDMMLHWKYKQYDPGLFFKLHVPIGAMIISHNFKELKEAQPDNKLSIEQTGPTLVWQDLNYPTPHGRQQSISEAFFGGLANNELHGNVAHVIRLRAGRITVRKLTEIRLGDLAVSLGYNIITKETGFFGIAFKASCPTGNVPTASYMLEPIFGRAGAWGVGAELSGSCNLWNNDIKTKKIDFQTHGEVLHLMPGRTPNYRSFDLKANGPGSKYLLVQQYDPTYSVPDPAAANTEVISAQRLHPALNLTTLPVISKIAVEGSLAAMFVFSCENWKAGLGAEFWGRSKECLAIDMRSAVDLRAPNLNNYAVVGRQAGVVYIDSTGTKKINLCEPLAKINKSKNPVTVTSVSPFHVVPLPDGIVDATDSQNRIPANLNDALDIPAAQASRVFTGKLFGNLGYCWSDCAHEPTLGVTGGAEFTNNTNNAVQLWSVGLFGSLSF